MMGLEVRNLEALEVAVRFQQEGQVVRRHLDFPTQEVLPKDLPLVDFLN